MIDIDHVSMKFSVANDRIMSLKEYFLAAVKGKLEFKDFWAFKDVSFHIDKGDVVGIIGKNGAGKSTLLKIISGVLAPTEGKVTAKGNIVPMLELGSGFDYELSGRENIFLNGAILGYNEDFLKEKYDEIVEFSELGDFIESPIRNYSSGMLMRLAFSIATIVEPEILIVDEILAVGDEAFQKKSKRKMLGLMGGGTTVLFVSHSIGQIREMCNKVAWLDGGKLRMFGDTKQVCDAYQEYMNPSSKDDQETKTGLYLNNVDQVCKDVLYIYGKREENYYWRVGVAKEELLSVGIRSSEVYFENVSVNLADQFRCFVFVECPRNERIVEFISRIKHNKKTVIFDMISVDEEQEKLLKNCKEYVDEITVIDSDTEIYYSKYGRTFINPYVPYDRIMQLSTWALYDRDVLPQIDPETIDSEDMLKNYNRAIMEARERQNDKYRVGCFSKGLYDDKYKELRKKLVDLLKNKDGKLFVSATDDLKELVALNDKVVQIEEITLEDKPRLYSRMDMIVRIDYIPTEMYTDEIITSLVKTKLCKYNRKNGDYNVEDITDERWVEVRSKAAVLSGIGYYKKICSIWNTNYVFLTDLKNQKLSSEIIRYICALKENGRDVIILDESSFDKQVKTDGIDDIPILNRAAMYFYMSCDNLIATHWTQYDFLLNYTGAKNKYYIIEEIETEKYDDGDYSKFRVNTTYVPKKGIEILTDDKNVADKLKSDYGVISKKISRILDENHD